MKTLPLLIVAAALLVGCKTSDQAPGELIKPDKADLKVKADRANEYDGVEGGLTWEF